MVLPVATLSAGDDADLRGLPDSAEIITKALAWADWQQEQPYIKTLTGLYENVTEVLDKRGELKSRDEILHRMESFDGHTFYRRVRINGRALTDSERRQERERRRRFLEDLKRQKLKSDYSRSEGTRHLQFDRDLVSRYRSKVVGREEVNSRTAYLLEFEPKSKRLPVRRRIDYALNHSRGKVWIDTEDYGVARIEFHLIEPVTFFFFLGKLTRADGVLQMVRLENGHWLPQHLKLYYNGRIFFRRLHRRSTMKWSNFGPGVVADGG